MGLQPDDLKPFGISLSDAYANVRTWYSAQLQTLAERGDAYGQQSTELIQHLPPSGFISELEIRAVLGEVLYGYLEWGYHHSDGHFKMAAYAHAALNAAGLPISLTPQEKGQLMQSKLWPFLQISRT